MKMCLNCNKTYGDSTVYCTTCGTKLVDCQGNANQNNDSVIPHQLESESGSSFIRQYGIFIVFILTFICAVILEPGFLKVSNLTNAVKQIVPLGIVACAETILIVSGAIDLAAGTTLALASCVGVRIILSTDSVFLAFLAAIATGMVVNLISGVLVTKFKMPPFIATLAMMKVAEGATGLCTNGEIISIREPQKLEWMVRGTVLGIPVMVILFAVVLGVVHIIMKRTMFGLQMYAMGGNAKAAAAGINVSFQMIAAFVMAGVLTGIAAMVTASYMFMASSTVGQGYEFDAITATIVGGTAFTGGVGGAKAIVAGTLTIGLINNVLALAGINASWRTIIKGALLALAVVLDLNMKKGNGKA